MKSVIARPDPTTAHAVVTEECTVVIDRHHVTFCAVELPEDSLGETGGVLVRTRAFSLNYRDRALLADPRLRWAAHGGIGSEFVGEVVDAEPGCQFRPGDRVMADMTYPVRAAPYVPGGVPTNTASRELAIFDPSELRRVPDQMTDDEAACFVLTSQTAAALVRRVGAGPGDHVLVTAATSNTSVAVAQLLRAAGAAVTLLTRSPHRAAELSARGDDVVIADRPDALARLASAVFGAGFNAMIDPFGDVYLPWAPRLLATGGRYATCGRARQGTTGSLPDDEGRPSLEDLVLDMVAKNLSLHGSCLGTTDDLDHAIDAWKNGALRVQAMASYGADELRPFLEHSLSPDRTGKAVFCYGDG